MPREVEHLRPSVLSHKQWWEQVIWSRNINRTLRETQGVAGGDLWLALKTRRWQVRCCTCWDQLDCYALLNVPKNATADTIKVAYRKQAKQLHPDVDGGSHGTMAQLNMCYEALTQRRAEYDAKKAGPVQHMHLHRSNNETTTIDNLWLIMTAALQSAAPQTAHSFVVGVV
eukprot:3259392-Amphidinium_carterae.1